MPGVLPPNSEYFASQLGDLFNRVRAIETQQQLGWTNALGQLLITMGLVPGSNPAEYGLQLLNPATGSQLAFIGEDGAGNVAIKFFDGSGNVRITIDANGFHQYDAAGNQVLLLGTQSNGLNGLGVYNGSTIETMLGLINASPAIYGLAVRPYGLSALQQVSGWLSSGALSASGVSTSSHYVTFSGSPTITAEIGPSGTALIGGAFEIDANNTGVEASVNVSIDSGASDVEVARLQVSSTAATTVNGPFLWGGMTAGTHTFTAQYLTSGTGTANFYGNIYIQPL